MNVIDLGSRRNPPDPGDGYAACRCGSGWFLLRLPSTDGPAPVCMSPDGTVTGYAGTPFCSECGEIWSPR